VIASGPVLYARLLGPDWFHLAEPIRAFHDGASVCARGRMRVVHGRGTLARAAIWNSATRAEPTR
jgi:hypothetical protein